MAPHHTMMGTHEKTPGEVEVRVHEPQLTSGVADILRRQLNALVKLDTRRVVLDFGAVASADVAGLAAIVWLRKRLGEAPEIVVRDASPAVREALHRTHLDRIVTLDES